MLMYLNACYGLNPANFNAFETLRITMSYSSSEADFKDWGNARVRAWPSQCRIFRELILATTTVLTNVPLQSHFPKHLIQRSHDVTG